MASRFSSSKGISSDQLFGLEEDNPPDARYMRQSKLSSLSGARAISSDMYFDRAPEPASPYESAGQSFDTREMAEQAADKLRNVGQGVAKGVSFIKDAGGSLLESLQSRYS